MVILNFWNILHDISVRPDSRLAWSSFQDGRAVGLGGVISTLVIRAKLDFPSLIQGAMDAEALELMKKGPGVRFPDKGKQVGIFPWGFDRDG